MNHSQGGQARELESLLIRDNIVIHVTREVRAGAKDGEGYGGECLAASTSFFVPARCFDGLAQRRAREQGKSNGRELESPQVRDGREGQGL